jgi:hypothetical protein
MAKSGATPYFVGAPGTRGGDSVSGGGVPTGAANEGDTDSDARIATSNKRGLRERRILVSAAPKAEDENDLQMEV